MKSPKQDQAFDIISRRDKLTVAQIAKEMGIAVKAAGAHLRRLEQAGRIHVSEWRFTGVTMSKCYTAGFGESVTYTSKRKPKQKLPKEPKPPKEDVLDIYIAPNNGWVSQIHAQDPRMNHAEHIRYMNSFKPQPDPASQWLFNQPAVELQGNKHE